MKLADLLKQIRAADGRTLSFQANNLQAQWDCGDSSATIEAAAAEDGKPALPTIVMAAYNGGLLQIGWGDPVLVDLAGMQISAKARPILKDHSTGMVVGHSTEITNTGKKLSLKGIASGTGPAAIEVIGAGKNGFPWQASIGARVLKAAYIDEKKTVEANGRTFKGPLIYVSASSLGEVSFVALGGDDTSSAQVAASANHSTDKESHMHPKFKLWLKAADFSDADITEMDGKQDTPTYKALHAAWKQAEPQEEETPPAQPPARQTVAATGAGAEDAIATRREAEARETERVDAIRAAAKGFPKIEAQAIREGWSADKTELAVLRASRPQAANIQGGGSPQVTPRILEAAACLALGMRGERFEQEYGDQILSAASKMRHIGLQELLLQAAAANGYSARPGAIKGDLSGVLHAAFSSNDISGILSNIANKFLLESYMAVEQTWRQVSAIRPANDFKTMTSYRLTGDLQFEKVAPTGEIKHGSLGNDSYTNKVDTHAKMLGITRQDMVNDDLGALQKTPALIGRGAALQLNEVFWTEFLRALTTFYTTARGNYQSGAGTVLGIDSLTAAELLFLNQTDSNAKPLGITPKFLLTPNALAASAAQLMRSTELRDTTANTKFGVSNPHAGKFEVIRSSYLNNSKVPNGSATHWFLLADPRELAVIETAFLNGVETPTLESAEADFNTLGIQIRGFFDFGVAQQEYRAGVCSKGAA